MDFAFLGLSTMTREGPVPGFGGLAGDESGFLGARVRAEPAAFGAADLAADFLGFLGLGAFPEVLGSRLESGVAGSLAFGFRGTGCILS